MAVSAATNVRKGINMAKENGLFASIRKDAAKVGNKLGIPQKDPAEIERKQKAKRESKIAKTMEKTLGKDRYAALVAGQDTEAGKAAFSAAYDDAAKKVDNTPVKQMKEKIDAAHNRKVEKRAEALKNDDKYKDLDDAALKKEAEKQVNEESKAKKEKRAGRVKKITGAASKVSGTAGKILNSETARYIRKTMLPASIGFAIGSMAYGGTDVFTAIGTGNTVFKGAQAFALNSPKTIAEEASKYIDKRTSSKEETIIKCEEVYQKGESGVYDTNSDEMKDILNELKAVLRAMGKGDDFSTLKSKIAYETTKNPETFDLNSILQEIVGAEAASNSKLADAAQEFADFTLDSNLYKQMKNGTDLGMEVDDFANKLSKMITYNDGSVDTESVLYSDLSSSETDSSPITGNINITSENIIEQIQRTENIEEIINSVDEKEIDNIEKRLSDYIAEILQEKLGSIPENASDYQRQRIIESAIEETKMFDSVRSQLIAKRATAYDNHEL